MKRLFKGEAYCLTGCGIRLEVCRLFLGFLSSFVGCQTLTNLLRVEVLYYDHT
ncbi:MAG: hypothetical protein LBK06_00900 [Planctomycetaceae bacterium]|nr:hypothetical protein [Planctomycetaceae bacterium]